MTRFYQNVTLHAGDAAFLDFALEDEAGEPLENAGDFALFWSFGLRVGMTAIVTKTSGDGISVFTEDDQHVARVVLENGELSPAGKYVHQLRGTLGGRTKVLAEGCLDLLPSLNGA